jgi:phage replication-related protein YjqB (UPF0714/DUF867 family)
LTTQHEPVDVSRALLTTNPIDVTETGHLTELLYDDGDNDDVLVCAAHGGAVEPGTAEQALELATRIDASCWACVGFDGDRGAYETYHPPSSAIDTGRYDLLDEIDERAFETVVSLHGLGDDRVLVGGGMDYDRKVRVRERLDSALSVSVEVADEDGPYAGTAEDNFVNWLAANGDGLQLEEGQTARAEESDAVLGTLQRLVGDEL